MITKTKFCCTRDNLTIRGFCYKKEGNNLPIAIVSHGFMANLSTVKHYAKLLARLGYASFCFDFCGGCAALGKSDGKRTKMSVLTEVKDLHAVIEYSKNQSYTDSSRILLMGCSQGGFVSAITAARRNDIGKLVLFYPALCIPDDARRGELMLAKFNPQSPPKAFWCGPMRLGQGYVTDIINMDAFKEIAPYTKDVMIVHGTADRIVDIQYSQRAVRVYQSQQHNRSVVFHSIEKAKHLFSKRHDKLALQYLEDYAKQWV